MISKYTLASEKIPTKFATKLKFPLKKEFDDICGSSFKQFADLCDKIGGDVATVGQMLRVNKNFGEKTNTPQYFEDEKNYPLKLIGDIWS